MLLEVGDAFFFLFCGRGLVGRRRFFFFFCWSLLALGAFLRCPLLVLDGAVPLLVVGEACNEKEVLLVAQSLRLGVERSAGEGGARWSSESETKRAIAKQGKQGRGRRSGGNLTSGRSVELGRGMGIEAQERIQASLLAQDRVGGGGAWMETILIVAAQRAGQ